MPRERERRAIRHAGQLAEHALRGFFADRASQLSAAISYYALFAIFPIAILAVTGFSIVLGEEAARRDVLDFLQRSLPVTDDAGRQDLDELLGGVTRNTEAFGIIGVLGLLFSASGLMAAVRHGLNVVWGADEHRPPLQGKLLDLLLVVGIGGLIGVSLVASLVTDAVRDLGEEVADVVGSTIVDLATQALPPALAFLGFGLLYRFVPATAVRWRDAGLGALVATAGYAATKLGFGVYLSHIADFGAVYGSLGAIIAFVFFVFVNANVFLLGAEVAATRPAVRRGEYDSSDEGGPPLWRRILGELRGLAVRREPER